MAYAATAGGFPSSVTSAPRVTALQRALVWLVGASGAVVFIEPSPYEVVTLAAIIMFFATGLRLRLVFMPLLLLLVLLNVGYSIGAIPFIEQSEVANWIATSWYMAVTVIFFAMVVSEDTEARLDMLRRGLIVGGMIAALSGIAGYFNLVPGGHDLLTLYERARGTFKDPNVLGAFLILPALFALQSVVSDRLGKSFRSPRCTLLGDEIDDLGKVISGRSLPANGLCRLHRVVLCFLRSRPLTCSSTCVEE